MGAGHTLALFSHTGAMMDLQSAFNLAIGLIIAGGGWFARALWDAVQRLQKDLHDLERNLPINYVRKDEFSDSVKEIKDMLGKIFDKLDGKQDK
jgi:hypothetical protein